MAKSAMVLQIALFLAPAFLAHSQSLADLAKKEKERRSKITDARVITAEEAAKYITTRDTGKSAGSGQTAEEQLDKTESDGEKKAPAKNTHPDEPVDFLGRPESYWRRTMSEARQRVKELENEKNVLMLKQNRLENEFYSQDNGFTRESIQREIQKTFYEQDLNRENLEKARTALEDLEKEARKSGALPGWISDSDGK